MQGTYCTYTEKRAIVQARDTHLLCFKDGLFLYIALFCLVVEYQSKLQSQGHDDRGEQEIAEYIEQRTNKEMFRSGFVNFELAFLAYNYKNTKHYTLNSCRTKKKL